MMISVEELNTQMTEMFLSSQLESIGWNSLTEGDKSVALRAAHYEINRLQFVGEPVVPDGDAFPRIINKEIVGIECGVDKALCQYVYDFFKINTDKRIEMIRSGVTSVKVEGASESYNLSQVDFNSIHRNYRTYLGGLIYRGV